MFVTLADQNVVSQSVKLYIVLKISISLFTQSMILFCIVTEDIHTSPLEGKTPPTPPEILIKLHTFL